MSNTLKCYSSNSNLTNTKTSKKNKEDIDKTNFFVNNIHSEPSISEENKIEIISYEIFNSIYKIESVIGTGTFSIVYRATKISTGKSVAIKKVAQEIHSNNHEFSILKILNHPNIIEIQDIFYYKEANSLNAHLILNLVPCNLSDILKTQKKLPLILIKYYFYQLCRALAYIHAKGICHRDIKPSNILVDKSSHRIILCDFGSAQKLDQYQFNVSYVCSRFYRAPELLLGSRNYSVNIDSWSLGCVLAELLLGRPLFKGSKPLYQLVSIIKILGIPTQLEWENMNASFLMGNFPKVKPLLLSKIFSKYKDIFLVDLLKSLLQYTPAKRSKPVDILCHPFFDELRHPDVILNNPNISFQHLYDFTEDEIEMLPNDIHLRLTQ